MLFLQIAGHSPLLSKEPKHSQNELLSMCTHTYTVSRFNLKRWDFKDDLKDGRYTHTHTHTQYVWV